MTIEEEINEQMRPYTGTKNILAAPIRQEAYYQYRGWELPEGKSPDEMIYLVEYEAEEKSEPNHPNHKGYISMSPKHVFDKAYKESGRPVDRLLIEMDDLSSKIDKLTNALYNERIPKEAIKINREQLAVMKDYHAILKTKLNMFV